MDGIMFVNFLQLYSPVKLETGVTTNRLFIFILCKLFATDLPTLMV